MKIVAKVMVSEVRPNIPEELSGMVEYDLGEAQASAPERINYLAEKYGAEAIVAKFEDAVVVEMQALIRRNLVLGSKEQAVPTNITPEKLQAKADEHKVSVGRKKGKSLEEKYLDQFADMTQEQQIEALTRLQGQATVDKK